jgi:UDP-3-O-[3-hydroxymyristoyl] N-acetylglucosamine deacetylase
LTLLGRSLVGAFSGYKSGHALNNKLLRALLAGEATWESVTFDEGIDAPINFMQPMSAGRDAGPG